MINQVADDILQGIRDTNHDYGRSVSVYCVTAFAACRILSIVALIASGRLLGTLASTQSGKCGLCPASDH